MLTTIRQAFLAGIVVLTPLAVTLYVFNWLVSAVGGRFRNIFFFYDPDALLERPELQMVWNFLATIMVIALITALGYLSRYVIGRVAVGIAERVIDRLPFIRNVYTAVKQIVQTFSMQQKAIFQQSVLVEYPRTGVYVLGFLTSEAKGEAQARTASELLNIFVPTTPNPTSGFLLMVPKEEVIHLDMSIADGMKLIVSGGAVVPEFFGNEGGQQLGPVLKNEPDAARRKEGGGQQTG